MSSKHFTAIAEQIKSSERERKEEEKEERGKERGEREEERGVYFIQESDPKEPLYTPLIHSPSQMNKNSFVHELSPNR